VIVPKYQHTAVERNRLKRRLRELVRLELLPALRDGQALDIAIRAQAVAYAARLGELRTGVRTLLARMQNELPHRG
jgi:ribonuclease P protein component